MNTPEFYQKNNKDLSMAITADASHQKDKIQKIALSAVGIGVLLLFVAAFGAGSKYPLGLFIASVGLITLGGLTYGIKQYLGRAKGIKNNGTFYGSLTGKGSLAWIFTIIITGFYVLLYWFPSYLEGLIRIMDPLSFALTGGAATQWFLYGFFYTLCIFVMGIKFIFKYRHNRYQIIRTISVMFFQTCFAFILPEVMKWFNKDIPYIDLKNMWPLNYYFFDSYNINSLINPAFKETLDFSQIFNPQTGWFGLGLLLFGLAMIFIISPFLTYFFGKRWYCSWVCGCGGLAETAGDPFRQQSDKSLKAWKIERWLIHLVLVFVVIMTAGVIYTYFSGSSQIGFINTRTLRSSYGFFIGAAFSGVIGVGFYPLMGSRVWCRFGCPMAAILGLQQKFFSRFRITTNGGQCISCGNCSTYCEMGIDVKWYAQRGQNIVRASCVGCGICSAVCPRGVLKLENGKDTGKSRMEQASPITLGNDGIQVDL